MPDEFHRHEPPTTRGSAMKKRERLDAELEEVHKQLARISTGASVLQPSRRASGLDPEDESPDDAEKRIVAPGPLTTSAFQLAGYVVATLALGRSIPATIVLAADAEYDVGRCSETDLHAIWTVGDLAAERARGEGCRSEPGPSIVIFKMESDSGDAFGRDRETVTGSPEQTAKRILNDSWDDIVRLARLLAEGRTLSRAEIEAELEADVFRLSELKDALGDGR
ncbi:MAG TPA: hypothetical protein VFB88_08405 [Xanthobacteraceae bacterium]|nr:hypothetical protein [Xanthobacteraceae bacterium]